MCQDSQGHLMSPRTLRISWNLHTQTCPKLPRWRLQVSTAVQGEGTWAAAYPLDAGHCGHSGCPGVFPARGGSCSFEGPGKRLACEWGQGQARQAQRQSPAFVPELHPLHMFSAHGANPSRGPKLHGLLQPAASGPDSRGWASSLVTVDM